MTIVASANRVRDELNDDGNHIKCENKNENKDAKRENKPMTALMKSMGIVDEEEIKKFKDPEHWVKIFSRRAMDDLKKLGICADFSRSFVTTKMNPYFDSFVK